MNRDYRAVPMHDGLPNGMWKVQEKYADHWIDVLPLIIDHTIDGLSAKLRDFDARDALRNGTAVTFDGHEFRWNAGMVINGKLLDAFRFTEGMTELTNTSPAYGRYAPNTWRAIEIYLVDRLGFGKAASMCFLLSDHMQWIADRCENGKPTLQDFAYYMASPEQKWLNNESAQGLKRLERSLDVMGNPLKGRGG